MNQGYQTEAKMPVNNASYGYYMPYAYAANNQNDERLAGGFVFPFLLGGVTGAALAPAFWRPNRPVYYPPYQPMPYPPRRWY